MAKTNTGVPVLIIVESTHLTVYTPTLPQGQSVQFPVGTISNMEIVKPDILYGLVAGMIDTAHLENAVILFAFGPSLYFDKKVPLLPPEKIAEEMKSFSASTPFDRVAVKDYKQSTSITLVSINRDFFDTLREIFSHDSLSVAGVIPIFVLSPYVPKGQLNPAVIKTILSKLDTLKEDAVATGKLKVMSLQEQEEYLSSHYQGLIVVVFIFFIVAVFAGTFFILRRQQAAIRPKPTPIPTVSASPIPLVAVDNTPLASESAIASPSGTKVTVSYSTKTASLSAGLVKTLSEKGFQAVGKKQSGSTVVAKPLVLVGETLSPTIRQMLEDVLKLELKDYSIQAGSDLGNDVTITLGQ